MSSDVSGDITAIATAVLAVFAIVTAVFAFLAYRKQSQETDILIRESRRQARERRSDQASRVFI
jgi:heme exporter protein D